MVKNDIRARHVGNPASRLQSAEASRGPSAQAIAYGIGGGDTGQSARSEFSDLNNPGDAGFGYDATTPDNNIARKTEKTTIPRDSLFDSIRRKCLPGHNPGRDYKAGEAGSSIRSMVKPSGKKTGTGR
jgi:hypothetical protein